MTARLNWGAGEVLPEDWTNSDAEYRGDFARLGWCAEYQTRDHGRLPGSRGLDHEGSIQDGLPWADGTFDYVVTHHGLMMLPEADLVPALVELRRVTNPRGWLRVSVPNIDGAIRARKDGRKWWFPVEAPDIDTAFCLYVTQGGATRSIFTGNRLARVMIEGGWTSPCVTPFGVTNSAQPGITDLDSRPDESIFMEAMNPG